jgi:hypothetical protein
MKMNEYIKEIYRESLIKDKRRPQNYTFLRDWEERIFYGAIDYIPWLILKLRARNE